MLHVFPKTFSVLEAGEEGVGVPPGASREVFAHGEIDGTRYLVLQGADRREEILHLFRGSHLPDLEKHEMVYHGYIPLAPDHMGDSSRWSRLIRQKMRRSDSPIL